MDYQDLKPILLRFTSYSVWDFIFLFPALILYGIIAISYLQSHPFPGLTGGLYATIARQLVQNSFVWPAEVSLYSVDGLPLLLPPLGFYLMGIAYAITEDILFITRILPVLFTIFSIPASYLFIRELYDSSRIATIGAALLATNPFVLKYHITAAGTPRVFAFTLMFLVWLYSLRAFRSNEGIEVYYAGILFGCVVLTHPVYTLFCIIGVVSIYEVEHGDGEGLIQGLKIAGTGSIIASPWFLWHAIQGYPFALLNASSSHRSGLLIDLRPIFTVLSKSGLNGVMGLFLFLSLLGILYSIKKQRWTAILIFFLTGALYPPLRLLHTTLSIIVGWWTAVVVVPRVRESVQAISEEPLYAKFAPWLVVALLMSYMVAAGGVYAGAGSGDGYKIIVSSEEKEAMEWSKENTDQNAVFLVPPQEGEWFPAIANRTTATVRVGTEWLPPEQRSKDKNLKRSLSTCRNFTCYMNITQKAGVNSSEKPVYIWTYKESEKASSLNNSSSTYIAYQNKEVIIYNTR